MGTKYWYQLKRVSNIDMKNIYVAGHRGMVGSAICRQLQRDGDVKLITAKRSDLNLTNQNEVKNFFNTNCIDEVYLAAAKVGGIYANNTYPADFIYENLMIEANVIDAAHQNGVEKLLFLGSSCIYPKLSHQPIVESSLLTGPLESTNEPYAIAKIAGIKLCESYNRQHGCDYRSVMPTNLYGPGDDFHLENSHVIPALIRRFHEAKLSGAEQVSVWGSGSPRREFLHVDDMAACSIHVMNLSRLIYEQNTSAMLSHVNVGTGEDVSIRELTNAVASIVGFDGEIVWDTSKPDGAQRKLMNVGKVNGLGWRKTISLMPGLKSTYTWFLENIGEARQ